MLLIKVKIKESKINGIGLFANQFIPEGTLIWEFKPGFDLRFDKAELDKLPKVARDCYLKYCYLNPTTKKYVLCFDDARFFNHSDEPNCREEKSPDGEVEGITVAARDIQPGEELTANYRDYDGDYEYKLSIS